MIQYSGDMAPAENPALLAEAHQLTGMLFRVAERAQRDFATAAATEGLTAPLARMLLLLEEPRSMRAVAEHLQCDASNVTGLTDRLADRGLVERVTGPDRRVRMVGLTAAGRAARTRLAAKVAQGSTVTRALSDAQRRRLRPLLAAMLAE